MKIGVTGGAGFIGGHVVDELARRGHEPVIFDHLGRTARSDIPECYRPVLMGDVRDPVAMCELAAHVDGIIHLAACLGTQETIKNPRPAAETNVQGGLNFLEAIAQYDIPGVYIGVGNHWMNNTYSISKTTVERFVAMFNKERGTRCNIVRLVNAYGPYQSVAPPFGAAKVRKITPSFVCRALTGQPIEVYGDGQQVSDMVHVTDGAKALVSALEKAAEGVVLEKAVEVGPADHRTVNEVAELVIKAAVDLGFDEVPLTHLPMRPGEIPGARVTADTSTLPLVGMSADKLVPLEDGIADVVAWYARHWLPRYRAEGK
ncbi:NAD-dependent epimerase/dehydratase family protein [Streptomyces sp. NPDC046931]|uniref:NAD-dependent epimerase/dehydratase family protein n=1 Tax=Streptomyces sp. NPDC046931 TaxID=3154806 RepID=UPI0033C836DE